MPDAHEAREPELRQLRALVAVLDTGSFTAAAQRLRIAQPALSRQVAGLERLVGHRLVDRAHHPLRPTTAGAAMLPHARRVLATAADTLDALDAGRATLRVGFAWNAAGTLTSAIVADFEVVHPDVTVVLRRVDSAHAGADDGRTHLALVRTPPSSPWLAGTELFSESRVAALPADHPLADRTELELADLADDPLVVNVVSGVTSPQLWPDHGRDRHTVRTRNSEEWVYAIALGRGIGVTVTSTAELFGHPGVRFVPVVDAPAVPVLAVWPRRGAHPLVPDLIEAGRRVAARPERAEPEPGGGAV